MGGSAGDGAPLNNAAVFLTDATGKTVSGRTNARGGYLLRFRTADFQAPFVLKVIDAGGNVLVHPVGVDAVVGPLAQVWKRKNEAQSEIGMRPKNRETALQV